MKHAGKAQAAAWRLIFLSLGAVLVLLVVGFQSIRRAPLDVFPEFAPPIVEIQTEAPGLSSEQVESLGARFVELELEAGASEDKGGYAKQMDEEFYHKQRALMARVVAESDLRAAHFDGRGIQNSSPKPASARGATARR